MNCKEIKKKLIFYIDKDLSAEEERSISEHLSSCKECSAFYHKLVNTFSIIEEEKEAKVNPFLFTGIEQKINKPEKVNYSVFDILRLKIIKAVYISAIFVVAIIFGIQIGNRIFHNHQKMLNKRIVTENTINTDGLASNEADDGLGLQ